MKHNPSIYAWGGLLLLAASVLFPRGVSAVSSLEVIRDKLTVRAAIDRENVPLSGSVVLTLSVEGPARVEVAPPRPLLLPDSAQVWLVKEMGLPTVELLKGGRQRWQQEFRLSPFEAGSKVAIKLSPLQIKAGDMKEMPVHWNKSLQVQVTTSIAQIDEQALRPVTDIEALPELPPQAGFEHWWVLAAAVAVGTLLALVAWRLVSRRKRTAAVRRFDAAWALQELDGLRRSGRSFERLAEIVRLYLQDQFNVPAAHLTTAEVVASITERKVVPPALEVELRAVLERCDTAKFATGIQPADEFDDSIDRAVQFVEHAVPANAEASLQTAAPSR